MQVYCLKCRAQTDCKNCELTTTGRKRLACTCAKCGAKKSMFVGAGFDLHKILDKLPKPKNGWTLPKHKFTGPGNPLDTQLDENDKPLPGYSPYNQIDGVALNHDICYRDNNTHTGKTKVRYNNDEEFKRD